MGLPLGTVTGHRGPGGAITVRVISGKATRWTGLAAVRLGTATEPGEWFGVRRSRAYRDRLVLELEGIDDATAAGNLRGRVAWAEAEEVPALADGEYYQQRLLGLEVIERRGGRRLGRIEDVIETGGADVLVVQGCHGEILIPMAREFLVAVDAARGKVEVQLPEGLEELNRAEAEDIR